MEFSRLPIVIQSTAVLIIFVVLFLLSTWALETAKKKPPEKEG